MDEQRFQNEYRTGRTQPKKSHRGAIALLLILVIFLGGIISALGLLNIRISQWLSKETPATAPVSFSQSMENGTPGIPCLPEDTELSMELEGMQCQELNLPCQRMYGLPPGLYVAAVENGSRAQALGIVPGDVLTSFDGTPVSQLEQLQELLNTNLTSLQVEIVTYRNGQHNRLTLTIEKE